MNSVFKKLTSGFRRGSGLKNLVISIVILVEVLAIMGVATFAWVETISSIRIKNTNAGTVDNVLYTSAHLVDASTNNTVIDIGNYFRRGGDMHLSPASSADGVNFFFPKTAGITGEYRKGNTGDMNTAYLSVTFKLSVDVTSEFCFTNVPTFTNSLSDDIRVSVYSRNEDGSEPECKIFAKTVSGTQSVVANENGTTGLSTVNLFSTYTTTPVIEMDPLQDKIITINLWLQKKNNNVNTDLTSDISTNFSVTNLGLTRLTVQRKITLIPTPAWDISGVNNQNYYAWCWNTSSDGELIKLEKDANTEHLTFDYDGSRANILFIRCGRDDLETSDMSGSWRSLGLWNKTYDLTVPAKSVSRDPTYIIMLAEDTASGATKDGDINKKRSTGEWIVNPDPVAVTVDYVNGQDNTWGTLTATSYKANSVSDTNIMETTDSSSQHHVNTVHAWTGSDRKIQLTATPPSTDFAFVGWYDNAAGTGTALSNLTTYSLNAPETDKTYYAKFKKRRTFTLEKYVDGVKSTIPAGTLSISDSAATLSSHTSSANVDNYSSTFDKDTPVYFTATAETGYTLTGIYTTPDGTATGSSPLTLSNNTTYYARFTTNNYTVKTWAYYASTNGSTTYTAGDTGGTVQTGTAAAGSTSELSVKYTSSVTLTATPAAGYSFEGWYNGTGSSATRISQSASYSYTLNTASNVDIYARFMREKYSITLSTDTSTTYGSMTTPGNKVQIDSGTAGTSASANVQSLTTVTLKATMTKSYYEFAGWYDGSTLVSSSAEYTFTPTSNITYTAKFNQKIKTYYFEDTNDWDTNRTMYLYAWADDDGLKYGGYNYPGYAIHRAGSNGNHDVYGITMWLKYDRAILNNNTTSGKSSDIDLPSAFGSDNCIYFSGNNPGGHFNYTPNN